MRTTKTVSRKIPHNFRKILLLIKMDHGRRMGFAPESHIFGKKRIVRHVSQIYLCQNFDFVLQPDEAAPSFENSSDDDCSDTDEEPFERNEYPSEKLRESYENMRKDPNIQASLKSLVEKRNKQGSQSKRSGAGE